MRRAQALMAISALLGSAVVLATGEPKAAAQTAPGTVVSRCAFDPSTGTLAIGVADDSKDSIDPDDQTVGLVVPYVPGDEDGIPVALTIARDDAGAFVVTGDGFPAEGGCPAQATVETVDTVEVTVSSTLDSLTLTLDQRHGRFEPGRDPSFDGFAPGLTERGAPEIEFDVRVGATRTNDGASKARPVDLRLVVEGTQEADHIVAGANSCPNEEDPHCVPLAVNLNADRSADADIRVRIAHEVQTTEAPPLGAGDEWVHALVLRGHGGDDTIATVGGDGTGTPLQSNFVRSVTIEGGAGDDVLTGGAPPSLLAGGPGNDRLHGGPAGDRLFGDAGDDFITGGGGDDVIDGGPGNDVIDEGLLASGADAIRGGAGQDVVDYSGRSVAVTVAETADDEGFRAAGELNENDRIHVDVEAVRVPDRSALVTGGLRVVGEMEALSNCGHNEGAADVMGPCTLLVDPVRSLGVSIGWDIPEGMTIGQTLPEHRSRLWLFDLRTLQRVHEGACPITSCPNLARSAVDVHAGRAYGPVFRDEKPPDGIAYVQGVASPQERKTWGSCDLAVLDWGRDPTMPEAGALVSYDADCRLPVAVLGASIDRAASTLFLSAAPQPELALRSVAGALSTNTLSHLNFGTENLGQPLLIRSVAIEDDGLDYEWDLDLRFAGCGRRVQINTSPLRDPPIPPFTAKIGSDLIAYCWDTKFVYWNDSIVSGPQGYVVRIPLGPNGRPLAIDGTELAPSAAPYTAYRSIRTPTLPGYLEIVADFTAGLVAIVTEGATNGNSVWMFDPTSDRFLGMVTSGAQRQPPRNSAVGFDEVSGRMYSLASQGIIRVDTRARPLPAGTLSPIGANVSEAADWVNVPRMGVAPQLRRLFIPINFLDQTRKVQGSPVANGVGARYLVVEDILPEPPAPGPRNPDANTVQVDEAAGATEVRSGALGSAAGAHLVWTGGANRTVRSVDPGCALHLPLFSGTSVAVSLERVVLGTCASDFLLAPGHRELSVGATEVEAGAGSVARAAPVAFGSADVTGNDLKSAGSCRIESWETATRGNLPPSFTDPYGQGCDDLWDAAAARRSDSGSNSRDDDPNADPRDPRRTVPDPRDGTAGRNGRGFVLESVGCTDFSGAPAEHREALASAECEHAGTAAAASAQGTGLSLVLGGTPVSAASTASSVSTARTSEGQLTVVTARAEGVRVGPLSIREVRSVAVTKARGRTDTALAELERRWCGLGLDSGAMTSLPDELRAQVEAVMGSPPPLVRAATRQTAGCIDPAHPDNTAFIESLNSLLLGKVRLSVTAPNEEIEPDGTTEVGEDSPGGYQAVLIKHEDARGGDFVVNDDDSITVAGLELTAYNDGSEGRNRVIVQLAGVHAESRYGVTLLPQFSGFEGSFSAGTAFEGTPATRRVIPGTKRAPSAATIIEGEAFEELFSTSPLPEDPVRRFLGFLPEALKDLWRLFVQHPLEFLLLFFVFSLLGTPAYLAYRRRTFVGVVAG